MMRCGVITVAGVPCHNKASRDGGPCPTHSDHAGVSTQTGLPVYRCTGKTPGGQRCFQQVEVRNTVCRMHNQKYAALHAQVAIMRESLDSLSKEISRLQREDSKP